jgi:hypothetical protein
MPYSYELTDVQLEFFVHTCSIFRKGAITVDAGRRVKKNALDPTPEYTGIPCRFVPMSEVTVTGELGRQTYDIVQTMDLIRMHSEQDLREGDCLLNTTVGHPDEGKYFQLQGEPWFHTITAYTLEAYTKRSLKPPWRA